MANKPKYITDLENRMSALEANDVKVNQRLDTMEEYQDKILTRTGEIHTALMGTEYDQNGNGNGGGLVKRLGRVEKVCQSLDNWKLKTATRDAIIWIVVGGALTAVWSLIISQWNVLFHGPITP